MEGKPTISQGNYLIFPFSSELQHSPLLPQVPPMILQPPTHAPRQAVSLPVAFLDTPRLWYKAPSTWGADPPHTACPRALPWQEVLSLRILCFLASLWRIRKKSFKIQYPAFFIVFSGRSNGTPSSPCCWLILCPHLICCISSNEYNWSLFLSRGIRKPAFVALLRIRGSCMFCRLRFIITPLLFPIYTDSSAVDSINYPQLPNGSLQSLPYPLNSRLRDPILLTITTEVSLRNFWNLAHLNPDSWSWLPDILPQTSHPHKQPHLSTCSSSKNWSSPWLLSTLLLI